MPKPTMTPIAVSVSEDRRSSDIDCCKLLMVSVTDSIPSSAVFSISYMSNKSRSISTRPSYDRFGSLMSCRRLKISRRASVASSLCASRTPLSSSKSSWLSIDYRRGPARPRLASGRCVHPANCGGPAYSPAPGSYPDDLRGCSIRRAARQGRRRMYAEEWWSESDQRVNGRVR